MRAWRPRDLQEINPKNIMLKNSYSGRQFLFRQYGSIFIRLAVVAPKSAKSREILRKLKLIASQRYPRSSTMVPIESACNFRLVVTLDFVEFRDPWMSALNVFNFRRRFTLFETKIVLVVLLTFANAVTIFAAIVAATVVSRSPYFRNCNGRGNSRSDSRVDWRRSRRPL